MLSLFHFFPVIRKNCTGSEVLCQFMAAYFLLIYLIKMRFHCDWFGKVMGSVGFIHCRPWPGMLKCRHTLSKWSTTTKALKKTFCSPVNQTSNYQLPPLAAIKRLHPRTHPPIQRKSNSERGGRWYSPSLQSCARSTWKGTKEVKQ